MGSFVICFVLVRLVLPICMAASFLFRQNAISLLYLLLFLFLPCIRVPTEKTMARGTGIYLKFLVVVSILTAIGQLSFQIVLLSMPPYGGLLRYCEFLEKLLRHVGFIRLDELSALNCVLALGPDVVMLVVTSVIYILCRKMSSPDNPEVVQTRDAIAAEQNTRRKRYRLLCAVGKYLSLALLCVAGVMRPSLLSAIYFVTFLGGATWWASYHALARPFGVLLRCIAVISALHILTLYAIQTQWIQELVGADCNYCRYLGLMPLMVISCKDPRDFDYKTAMWDSYVNPVILLALYYFVVLESRLLMSSVAQRSPTDAEFGKSESPGLPLSRQLSVRLSQRRLVRNPTNRWRAATRKVKDEISAVDLPDTLDETTPLMRSVSPSGKYARSPSNASSGRLAAVGMYQDPLGSVIITDDNGDFIQLNAVNERDNKEKDGEETSAKENILDHMFSAAISVVQLINKSSYIATNIIMMAWSITYHSWITFVLLLWASLLWMMPNQRRAMLRCSPFLVCYAIMLLLVQYIYSLDLTDAELPQKVQGYNLKQIGLEKPINLPCKPLLAKCLYTIMFWLTLRQYMQEKVEARRSSALEDMVAPLAITVGTATRGFSEQMESMPSPFMSRVGKFFKACLTKFWIWVVAIMLFVIGISGERMTVLRVVYMALFLIFILTFQLSYSGWRKMLFGFWITVIIYSMTILVTVYTYQFDHFPEYWEAIGIPVDLQLDIGLEKFQTGDLFVRLLTPTFFLIITVIQLHYFHKDFLELSDIAYRRHSSRTRESSMLRSEGSSAAATREMEEMEREGELNVIQPESVPSLPAFRNIKQVSMDDMKTLLHVIYFRLIQVIDLLWLFLELHILQFVLLSIMLMCMYDVSGMNFFFLLLVVVALMFNSKVHRIVIHICSVLISILMVAKMVYQIEYIKHEKFATNCTNISANKTQTVNDVDWIGFHKSSYLPGLVKGHICIILVATLMALVNVRQQYKRHLSGRYIGRPHSMFPHIKREDADTDLASCIKYLFNYGFYKFGVEICLMTIVALIGTRMDLYAVFYAIWLCVLFAMRRDRLARVWIFFQAFIVVITPLQYAMSVGIPPGFCIQYPWDDSDILRRVQDWMYLPDGEHPPAAYKLACDFVLLLLVCRQSLVFRIEKRHEDLPYPGGTNKDITEECDLPGFVNPVPNHISYITSWLDIAKRGILSSFLWVTLASVFLTGTNRVNLFSIGYLVGSFIFLWQGEDIYLRPTSLILKWWNKLLGFNVFVICFKTLLQVPGCIFLTVMQNEACWLMQLLGIACIKKFIDGFSITTKDTEPPNECVVNREDVGLVWDGICFGFLIVMRRLFMSYYFMHQVDETKAMTILASRGAELIEELRNKQITEQQEEEHTIIEKIKLKMERIKATQQKIQGPVFKEPVSHAAAIRSGDYYMFDDFDEVELDGEKVPAVDKDDEDPLNARRVTLGKLFETALKTDIQVAADMALRKSPSSVQSRSPESHRALKRTVSTPLPHRPSFHSALSGEQTPLPSPAGSSRSGAHDEGIDDLTESLAPPSRQGSRRPSKERSEYSASDVDDIEMEPLLDKEDDKSPNFWNKIWMYIKFAWAFAESAMVSLTKYLNRFSRDYRYVMKVLATEKKMLKEKSGFGVGIRTGSSQVWQPLPDSQLDRSRIRMSIVTELTQKGNVMSIASSDSDPDDVRLRRQRELLGVPEIRVLAPSLERGLDDDGSLYNPSLDELEQIHELSALDQHPIVRLLLSLWYAIVSHSEIVCYFMVFLNQIKSATILSIPLPLMVFLWGTLTVPRPTKTFWVTIIAYTEAIVIIKCMFQFEMLPWNQQAILETMPFYPPRIIGIEKKVNYAVYDLCLLLIVFFHRFMLKSLGLWKSSDETVNFDTEADELFELDQEVIVPTEDLVKLSPVQRKSSLKHPDVETRKPDESDLLNQENDNPEVKAAAVRPEDQDDDDKELSLNRDPSEIQQLESQLRRRYPESNLNLTRHSSKTDQHPGKRLHFNENSDGEMSETSSRSPHIVLVHTEKESLQSHLPGAMKMVVAKYLESFRSFFVDLLSPFARVTADVYAIMFICDFFNFLVVIFGFSAFGTQQGDGGVSAYLEENKVPIPFLVMLILQFALIIVDRALFLRKFILGKIVFQYLLVIGVHSWMFFILPGITERQFNARLPPQMWYMVKCFYLLLSAYQIRCGYPTRILGNFLCKRFNIINMVLFKVFMVIPFLFELRALMDWIWTDTSMTLMDWLKMEDIFAHIFQLKCQRRMETNYPSPRGQKKAAYLKYLIGGGALFVIIAIIWFPLVVFALGSTVGEPNLPFEVSLTLRIGAYEPIYKMSAQKSTIKVFDENKWDQLNNVYKKDRVAQTFLSDFDFEDLAVASLSGNSTNAWGISPPDKTRLIKEIAANAPLTIKLTWEVSRISDNPSMSGIVSESQFHELEVAEGSELHPNRKRLLIMLNGTKDTEPVSISLLFPKFVEVTNRAKVVAVEKLLGGVGSVYRNLTLKLTQKITCGADCKVEWWELSETCMSTDAAYVKYLKLLPFVDCQNLVMYTFSEKKFPKGFSFISGGGSLIGGSILGLYSAYFFFAYHIVRLFIGNLSYIIMFTEPPCVDRVLELCLDIYLVRESGELDLEEDLFAKLVFLYRSPETLIKWTRPREEDEADGDEDGQQVVAANN